MATLESSVSVPQEVQFCDPGGEVVILNSKTGRYYGLDRVGARMWALLTEHGHIKAVYQALLREYPVPEDRLLKDLLDLVDELSSHGLLQVADA